MEVTRILVVPGALLCHLFYDSCRERLLMIRIGSEMAPNKLLICLLSQPDLLTEFLHSARFKSLGH